MSNVYTGTEESKEDADIQVNKYKAYTFHVNSNIVHVTHKTNSNEQSIKKINAAAIAHTLETVNACILPLPQLLEVMKKDLIS